MQIWAYIEALSGNNIFSLYSPIFKTHWWGFRGRDKVLSSTPRERHGDYFMRKESLEKFRSGWRLSFVMTVDSEV